MSQIGTQQEQLRALINEFKESGLSKSAFCRKKNITLSRFNYWKKNLSEDSEYTPGEFLRLTPEKRHITPDPQLAIVLRYPNGVSIQVPYDTPMITLRSFLNLV